MSLIEHLEELRRRIVLSLVGVTAGFAVCWAFHRQIFGFLERPIQPFLPEGGKLAVLGVQDGLIVYFKVAGFAGLFLASPWVLYQLWCFVAPGLYHQERRGALAFVLVGSLFFVGGGLFGYFVAFPFAVKFLLELGGQFQQVITVDRFLRFEMTVILGLGVMFEMPLLVFLLAQMGVVTPRFLLHHFRWAVLIIFIIAAVVTPTPDVFNLCVFAVPTVGLYLLGVAAAALVQRRKRREQV